MLPLDLHVLGLSLAFILSQDQTLRCNLIYFPVQNDSIFIVYSELKRELKFLPFSCTTSIFVASFSQRTLEDQPPFRLALSVAKSAAKLQPISELTKLFRTFFFTFFFRDTAKQLYHCHLDENLSKQTVFIKGEKNRTTHNRAPVSCGTDYFVIQF